MRISDWSSDVCSSDLLVNAERYITEELKTYEEQILGAEEKIQALETRLYGELVAAVAEYIKPIQLNAQLVARLDVLLNFAEIAQRNHYVKPTIEDRKSTRLNSSH